MIIGAIIALVLIVILIGRCSSKTTTSDTTKPSQPKTYVEDKTNIEFTKIDVQNMACPRFPAKITGHLRVKTGDFSNDLKFCITIDNTLLTCKTKNFVSGDNDFEIEYTPTETGKHTLKLGINFKDKVIFEKNYNIEVFESKLDFEINYEEKFAEADKSSFGTVGDDGYIYESYIKFMNNGKCPVSNVKYKYDIIDLETDEIIANSTHLADINPEEFNTRKETVWRGIDFDVDYPAEHYYDETVTKIVNWGDIYPREEKQLKLCVFKPVLYEGDEIEKYVLMKYYVDFPCKPSHSEKKEYKIIATVVADDIGPITKEKIIKIEKLFVEE